MKSKKLELWHREQLKPASVSSSLHLHHQLKPASVSSSLHLHHQLKPASVSSSLLLPFDSLPKFFVVCTSKSLNAVPELVSWCLTHQQRHQQEDSTSRSSWSVKAVAAPAYVDLVRQEVWTGYMCGSQRIRKRQGVADIKHILIMHILYDMWW